MRTFQLFTRASRARKTPWLALLVLALAIIIPCLVPATGVLADGQIVAKNTFSVYAKPDGDWMGTWQPGTYDVLWDDNGWVQLKNPNGDFNPWAIKSTLDLTVKAATAAPVATARPEVHYGSMGIGYDTVVMGHRYLFVGWPGTSPQVMKDGVNIEEWYTIVNRVATLHMRSGETITCNWWYRPRQSDDDRNYDANCSVSA